MAALSPTQAKVVKAKVKAELADIPQAVIAQQVFPNATPASAGVMMSRELNKVNVQEALQIALAKHDLTADRIMGIVSGAMSANKTVEGTLASDEGKIYKTLVETDTPDHSVRLKAAGMAAQFLGVGKGQTDAPSIHFHQHVAEQREKYGI